MPAALASLLSLALTVTMLAPPPAGADTLPADTPLEVPPERRAAPTTANGAKVQAQDVAEREAPEDKEPKAARATRDGGGWKFTRGRRGRRNREGRPVAALPVKSTQRTPLSPAGGYQGLRLQSKTQPPVPVLPHAKGAPVLTWVGFQRDTGNESVVFVQVDREVEHQFSAKRGRLELFLPGVKVTQKNHARTLDLRYFPQTKAKSVRTKVTPKGTTIVISVRGKAQPVVTTRPGPEGQHQVLVRFSPPS